MSLTPRDIALIKGMIVRGDRHSDIAAHFRCNQGRIAEINTGQRGRGIGMAPKDELPPLTWPDIDALVTELDSERDSNHRAWELLSEANSKLLDARDTLKVLRRMIDAAIRDIDDTRADSERIHEAAIPSDSQRLPANGGRAV